MMFINPYKLSFSKSSKSYAEPLKNALDGVVKTIDDDLTRGIRDNDYILDNTADILKDVLKQYDNFGIRTSGISHKIDKLAWFVGGNPREIKRLQQMLNQLGIYGSSGKLLEDGVYGNETLAAWETFLNKIVHGSVPTLKWQYPLKDAGLMIGNSRKGVSNAILPVTRVSGMAKDFNYLRIDVPHPHMNYPHVNIDFQRPMTPLQENIFSKFNHFEITDDAYNALKNLDDMAKKVRISGKVLLVAGIALDLLELGIAVDADLKDADKKLGKKTISTAARIGGRWLGAIGGAKLGAMGGAAIGAPLGPLGSATGAAIGGLVLGIVGAFTGDKLAEWIVDITIIED